MKKKFSKNLGKTCRGLLLAMALAIFPLYVFAQQTTINGTVVDPMGEVIIGASVLEKGSTSNGAITDIDGNFTIQVKSNSVLIVSYIGYKTKEVVAKPGRSLHIVLEENAQALDEVVVVGFGTQRKVNLTGAVGIATAKDLEARPVKSVSQALQGMIPGLNITTTTGQLDQNMSISVRGIGTIGDGSSGSPLILIDGMEGDINSLNPQDVESISVLKDAAAASIYGSRAPFGVVLITTKRGSAGKIAINYNNSFRISSPINLPEPMDSYSWAVMFNEAARNQGVNNYYTDDVMKKMLAYQAGDPDAGYGLDPRPDNPTVWDNRWFKGYANTDIWKEIYSDNVHAQEHNLSVTGGSEKMSYYISANYLEQGGLLNFGDEGLKRYTVTGKINATITNWLKFNYTQRFIRNDNWRPTYLDDSFYDSLGSGNWPNMPIYDANGNINHDMPRKLEKGGKRTSRSDRQYYQGSFIIEPIKNWVTTVDLNYSIYNSGSKTSVLTWYNYDVAGDEVDNGAQNTSLRENSMEENYMNINAYSSYSFNLADKHNFKVMGGFQAEEMKQHYFEVTKYGLISEDEDFWEFNLTNGLSGKGTEMDPAISGYSNEWATVGFFGRLNYDYKGRYLVEGNLRYDASSRFRRGNRWQFSPSFSLGWNVAEEAFFEPAKSLIGQLKPRFSYGVLGNQNTNAWYPTYRTMSLGSVNGEWLQNGARPNSATVGGLISTALTWETVKTWNVGLDFALLNNRLTGSFDYFTRYTKNMVGPAPQLPITLGLNPPKTNNCDLQTRGWELKLAWKDRLNNGLNYGVSVSLSDQTTYIDHYPGNTTGSIDSYMSGKKVGLIWGYETIGIAKTDEEMNGHLSTLPNGGQDAVGSQWAAGDIMYKDLNNDGKVDEGSRTWDDHGDLKIIGDSKPHYFYGIDLTAEWKGFDFRCFLQGVIKQDFWPGSSAMFWGVRGGYSLWHTVGLKQHEDYFRAEPIGLEGYEIPANLDSYYPRPIFSSNSNGNTYGVKNQRAQTRYLQNAGYMRLKNLQLGYTLPSSLTNKIGIGSCRFFVSGENLLTFTPLKEMFDPETCVNTNGALGKVYPLSSTWSFGLSLTF